MNNKVKKLNKDINTLSTNFATKQTDQVDAAAATSLLKPGAQRGNTLGDKKTAPAPATEIKEKSESES